MAGWTFSTMISSRDWIWKRGIGKITSGVRIEIHLVLCLDPPWVPLTPVPGHLSRLSFPCLPYLSEVSKWLNPSRNSTQFSGEWNVSPFCFSFDKIFFVRLTCVKHYGDLWSGCTPEMRYFQVFCWGYCSFGELFLALLFLRLKIWSEVLMDQIKVQDTMGRIA
jgi:hypothetical protein